MSKRQKAIEQLRQHPKAVRFDEVETILCDVGFVKRQHGTSHAVFRLGVHRLTIARKKPCISPKAVKEVLRMLDELDEVAPED